MTAWWERFPGRLEAELEDFRARGLDFELDESLFRDAGRVLLRGAIEHEERSVVLEVLYPDLFPYLRPEVYAPELSLDRHQNPVLHNLCLLERNTATWNPSETGAWLVAERVPMLLSYFDAGPEAMKEAEVPQGEPVSAYFPGLAGTAVFVPAAMLGLDPEIKVGSGRISFAPNAPPQVQLRGLLCELVTKGRSRKSTIVARADEPLARRFGGAQLQTRWARLPKAPEDFSPEGLFAAADDVQSGFGGPPWQKVADGEVAITGVIFPEEVHQGVFEDAWLFAVRARRESAGVLQEGAFIVRGERLTDEDLGARIPHLGPLRDAVVAQVGLGALGAPIALELARNRVGELRALEHDHVEASQIVRWPFGLGAVGHMKLAAIKSFIDADYPYTRVVPFQHRLGDTALQRQGREENEFDVLQRFLEGATLAIDASAEIGVQQLISDMARELGVPQLYVSATEGARGGQVALIVPGAGGCWHCWKQKALEGAIPLPPADDGGTVQPRGCAAPTFTGAGFDLMPVSAQAIRVAAAAMSSAGDLESKVWVCEIPAETLAAPVWSEHAVSRNPECPACGAA